MCSDLVREHSAPDPQYVSLFPRQSSGEVVGTCPRCGSPVREGQKGFYCDKTDCSFALWKDNRFFRTKKKTVTKAVAAALLKEGRVYVNDLYSEKAGKTYGAYVVLDDTGDKYVNFKEYPHGIIHFAPNVDDRNTALFNRAFETLEMFVQNGAVAETVVRSLGKRWEQPLFSVMTDLERKPSIHEQLKQQPVADSNRQKQLTKNKEAAL